MPQIRLLANPDTASNLSPLHRIFMHLKEPGLPFSASYIQTEQEAGYPNPSTPKPLLRSGICMEVWCDREIPSQDFEEMCDNFSGYLIKSYGT